MKTKTQRKTYLRRPSPGFSSSLQKFMVPPAILVFRELRRLEYQDRPALAHGLHHID